MRLVRIICAIHLEFARWDQYYDASIFQPTFNTFLASPGHG
ncbi:hypothetical protein UYSO10_1019 [Kosakonia radicincitans]|nr:hypothetical protein UYSO10_1019 [Kosakonia radicincitans]